MITHNQAVRLLAFAAAYDQRTVGEYDIEAWEMASGPGRWSYETAQRVIVEHYAADSDRPRITPAMVTDRLRTLRGRAAESFEMPRIPEGLPDGDYPKWLRGQLAAHCERILQRWATAGEEPPRGLLPAPAQIHTLPELVTAAPPEHQPAVASGVRALKARRVQLDPERRKQAHAELDHARPPAAPEPDVIDRARVRARVEAEAEASPA